MKDIKVYRFYKRAKGFNIEIDSMDKYPLIAITDNKKLAKDFEKTRNMDIYVKIVDEMSEDVYVQFINKHSGEEIDKESLLMYYDSDTGKYDKVYLPHTKFEYTCMQDYVDRHLLGEDGPNKDVDLLNTRYKRALETLGYAQIAQQNLRLAEDYDLFEFDYNELSLFLAVYKEYLSI